MADRYWVGGTASWDGTAGTKWATTSGGAGGAAVPTSADDVYFDANSGAVTVTISVQVDCRSLICTGFIGTLSGAGNIRVNSNVTLSSGMGFTHTGQLVWTLSSSGGTLTTAGKTVGSVGIGSVAVAPPVVLGDALTCSGAITLTSGTFTTNNYNVTATQLSSSNTNTRTINLGSSTVTLSGSGTCVAFNTTTGLSFNAGTSQINVTSTATPAINAGATAGSGVTYYNVSFTGANATSYSFFGQPCTFNNLSVAGRTSAGVSLITLSTNQTINGTLTLSAGTNAAMRTFVRSDTLGTTRTLTCAAVASLTDIDFRDITIAGAAAPVSGTRLGDCKGNSGITFPAPKTVYYVLSISANWGPGSGGSGPWLNSSSGTPDAQWFPLAQDTAVIPSGTPSSGTTVTVNAAYNIGTIDMSARTSNTMTLATGTQQPQIYGNWINGTGTTLTGTGVITFAGRGSQTITSAGKTFTQPFNISAFGGSVTLQDAFTSSNTGTSIAINAGVFDANGYNVTVSGAAASNGTVSRTVAIGSGTWTIAGTGGWNTATSTNLTVTGTGTISLTSASAKTFAGGDIQTYPTLNQGGTGTLTVNGSNKFAGLTNTAIGRIQFQGGTTNEFTSFTISGSAITALQLGSTNTTQAILVKPSTWQMGLLSTDAGNNTNLTFLASDGTMEYLSVSYINGVVSTPPTPSSTGNFLFFF